MPLIDPESETIIETSSEFYTNELNNSRILLFEINKAILAVSRGGNHSYSLSTGQSTQSVTRENLSELIRARDDLLYAISEIECMLGIRKNVIQVIPNW